MSKNYMSLQDAIEEIQNLPNNPLIIWASTTNGEYLMEFKKIKIITNNTVKIECVSKGMWDIESTKIIPLDNILINNNIFIKNDFLLIEAHPFRDYLLREGYLFILTDNKNKSIFKYCGDIVFATSLHKDPQLLLDIIKRYRENNIDPPEKLKQILIEIG